MDFEFTRGDTFVSPKIIFKDKDGNILGNVISMYYTVKSSFKDAEAKLQKNLNNGITFDGTGYVITINPIDTNNLDFKTYETDIQIEFSIDDTVFKKTVLKGTLTLTEEATWERNEV